jgi:hypothetical protein
MALIALAVVLSDGALSERGSAWSGGGKMKAPRETTQLFDSPLVKIRRSPYVISVVRIEGRGARLRDQTKGE